ncbi:MAG: hypothetical protein A3C27_03065 [Candidatus Levybacteria bacterium RIFCSPHIGHO2_02_FULL_39_36]|nr:MAG: hypothetical protein UT20_C0004G0019 [Candidatus Levybacteria bacterium GW2011_GWA1_39_11]KKR24920.1 MAG: hypothetical protein UT56_C0006G0017 [Candidatus Levybacteria bacterium GW2011_GWB1_39_7]KKR27215.1 MAG: hypothetical protein UT57_C0014G0004 [Microgenomates group bacterium GW2011_GWC1_39_7]KKR49946.1 MAG: hypothetical protein UT85_C0008G0017 [Candidatus Levybacteria bacterium GW2011_GWA2_40_16]OGD88414.1 MAG: hypothetical protein A2Z54_01360 [Candidatus Curtissbacteria bacterium R
MEEEFLGGSSQNNPQQERSSFQVREVFKVSRFDIKKPTVEGLEKLPPTPCVVATTHLSDIDVQEVAMVVANQRKIGIVSQETNLTFPLYKPFVAAIGKENFFPITNAPYKKGKTAYSLRLDDLRKMQEGITQEGRTMIVAGHNPTHNWQLAEKPGMAAVLLAHMANVPLVPVALDIESKTPVAQTTNNLARLKNLLNRPHAKIIFGDPIELAQLSEEKLKAAVGLYSPDQRRSMTPEQAQEARETLITLQRESEQMMEALASKLPPEKRGKWASPTPPNQNSNLV